MNATTAADSRRQASDGMLALICGYAPSIWSRRLLVMFQAFVDDSGKTPQDKVFVLAGVVSTADRWLEFSQEWAALCGCEPKTPDVHMREIYTPGHRYWRSAPPKERAARRDAKLAALAGLIAKHGMVKIHAALAWPAFIAATKGKLPKEKDTPYFFLFLRILQSVVKWQKAAGLSGKVDFVFDEQGDIGLEAIGWHYAIKDIFDGDEAKILSGTPVFKSDKEVSPLKAADMCAWYLRREVAETDSAMRKGEKFTRTDAMQALWNMPYVGSTVTEAQMRDFVAMVERTGG